MENKVLINGRSAEIERKWLIEIPCIADMEKMPDYNRSAIEQIYLPDGDRIRKRDFGDRVIYYLTHKEDINGISRYEEETEITETQYMMLKKNRAASMNIVNKVRHSFSFRQQIIEVDIYDFWEDKATLEIELKSEEQEVFIPDFIEVLKEVTGDKSYSNYALACKY